MKTLPSKLLIVNGSMDTKEGFDASFKTIFSNCGSISNDYGIVGNLKTKKNYIGREKKMLSKFIPSNEF